MAARPQETLDYLDAALSPPLRKMLADVRSHMEAMEEAARLLAVDLAPILDIRDPRSLLDEYQARAMRGERTPYGLWERGE